VPLPIPERMGRQSVSRISVRSCFLLRAPGQISIGAIRCEGREARIAIVSCFGEHRIRARSAEVC